MSGLNIQEVADEARKMVKFFKVFEKLDEVLKTLAMYDQLIRERKEFSESLQKEIQDLSNKKALLVKGFDDEVYTARINSENAAERYKKEQEKTETAILNLQNHYQEEEIRIMGIFNITIDSRQTESNNLLLEIEKNNKLLRSAQEELNILRAKLG